MSEKKISNVPLAAPSQTGSEDSLKGEFAFSVTSANATITKT